MSERVCGTARPIAISAPALGPEVERLVIEVLRRHTGRPSGDGAGSYGAGCFSF